jgi:hypothetical protein
VKCRKYQDGGSARGEIKSGNERENKESSGSSSPFTYIKRRK